jgi:hypothetical protein
MWIIQATRVQLATGFSRTREKPTSFADGPLEYRRILQSESFIQRGSASYPPVPTRNDGGTCYTVPLPASEPWRRWRACSTRMMASAAKITTNDTAEVSVPSA